MLDADASILSNTVELRVLEPDGHQQKQNTCFLFCVSNVFFTTSHHWEIK